MKPHAQSLMAYTLHPIFYLAASALLTLQWGMRTLCLEDYKLLYSDLLQPLRSTLRLISFAAIIVLFSGCSWFGKDDIEIADNGEQQIYLEAQRSLDSGNFNTAIRTLQLLESRYPFGRYAEQAQLELVYAHYGAYEFEAAIEAADRFIRLHPQHPNVDYAYYMKGLSAFDMEGGFLASFVPTDDTKRDVSHIKEAFAEFAQLLARFPDSAYAPDARARMVHMRNMLARHEVHVANYYFRRGAYMAALNRGRYVVEHMQQTPSVADGLAIMAQAYILLDFNELAKDSIAVLHENFPDHPSLNENGDFESVYDLDGLHRSWINQLSFGLFDPPEPPQFDYRPKG